MGLETATNIAGLVSTNPTAGDPVAQGDDHIRLIKAVLQSTPLVVDRAYAEYTTSASLTAIIPFDDTIPQVTEGTQILSVSITPKSTTNRLRIRFQGSGSASVEFDIMAVAFFVNGGANAVAAGWGTAAPAAGAFIQGYLEHEFVPGSTSAQTISVRVGSAGGTLRMNGSTATSARRFGGVARSTLVVEEIQA